MPFSRIHNSNSDDVNWGSLSLTSCSGNPYDVNKLCNTSKVFSVVVVDMGITSIHLEWASTTIRNIEPKLDLWSQQGFSSKGHHHDHGCNKAVGGLFHTLWQDWQSRTICSMCLSIKGHQTCVRASDFIFTIPGWLVCNSISDRTQELSSSSPTTSILLRQWAPVVNLRMVWAQHQHWLANLSAYTSQL